MLFGTINKGLERYHSTPGGMLVDVRESHEFISGHIPDAVNVPLSTIRNTSFPKETPLFLYCLRGTRSRKAVRILKRMGYANAESIGGINGYKGTTVRGE
ncbi:MAG: rhodanese-like domain-containing protein [Oscillospiraceae bacterium]|nr:rhodanese-like domain-containing protein [Oscillospiraceae bacterium]